MTVTACQPMAQRRRTRRRRQMPDGVGLYLTDVADHPLLTAEEEIRLSQLIERGHRATVEAAKSQTPQPDLIKVAAAGRAAEADFVRSNLRLVISIAKRYTGRGLDLSDLVQEGNLGLLKAVEKYEWRKGFKFSTYASWWIRQAITRGIESQCRAIRLPVHFGERLRTVQQAQEWLEHRLGRTPTAQEISERSGIPMTQVVAVLKAPAEVESLDRPLLVDHDATLADVVAGGSDPAVVVDTQATLQAIGGVVMAVLDPRESSVIKSRFGLDGRPPANLTEAGRAAGVSREQARLLERRALSKLRHPSLTGHLLDSV